MHENGQQSKSPLADMRQNVNLLLGVAQCVSKPVEILLRLPGTSGERYLGVQAVIGWVFCVVFPVLYRGHDPRPMFYFFVVVTLWLFVHRLAGWYRRGHGYEVHSFYSGRSIIGGEESTVKSVREPALVFMCGIVLMAFNVPLAAYLILSGIALAINTGCQRAADQARIRNARDARIDAMWMQQQMDGPTE